MPTSDAVIGKTCCPTDAELVYAAYYRCPCGAGLAHVRGCGTYDEASYEASCWDCSDILTGRAIPTGEPGAVLHTVLKPFTFWEIKSEDQPSANGATTRAA